MDEESLDIREYANVLLARWWLLALGPILAVLAALGISFAIPFAVPKASEYQATTNVVLMGGSAGLAEYPDLAKSAPVLEDAISDLALSMSVAELRSRLTVSNVVSQMVSIQATDAVPATALRLADAVAQSYISYLGSLGEPQQAAAQEQLILSLAALDKRVSADAADKGVAAVEEAVAALTARATPAIVLAPAEILPEPGTSSAASRPLARNTALAAILGLFLAVVVIFLLEYLQNPIRSEVQMERRFGLSNLGSVPRWRKGKGASSSTLERLDSETGLYESVSQVAASLDFTATACRTKTVALISPGQCDGRSSLVSCLGVALSNHWRQVILVDSDFRHPSLHDHFNLDNSLGLSNLLSNPDLELADVVQSTNYPRLQVITSGTVPSNPTNLVSSPRMSWVLERVKESAELVLIDTAPSLDTADGTLMASQVDAVVMVVNATQTRQDSMDATLENLRPANRNILGFIWNQRKTVAFSQTARSQRYFRTTPETSPNGAPYLDASSKQEAGGFEKLKAYTPHRYLPKQADSLP